MNPKENNKTNQKVDLSYLLELERKDKKDIMKKGYDEIPRQFHWTSIDEQKLKVDEIEKKTDEKKGS